MERFTNEFSHLDDARKFFADFEENGSLTEENYLEYKEFVKRYDALDAETKKYVSKKIDASIGKQRPFLNEIEEFVEYRKSINKFIAEEEGFLKRKKTNKTKNVRIAYSNSVKRCQSQIDAFHRNYKKSKLKMVSAFAQNEIAKIEAIRLDNKRKLSHMASIKTLNILSAVFGCIVLVFVLFWIVYFSYLLSELVKNKVGPSGILPFALIDIGFVYGFVITMVLSMVLFSTLWWDIWPSLPLDALGGIDFFVLINLIFMLCLLLWIVFFVASRRRQLRPVFILRDLSERQWHAIAIGSKIIISIVLALIFLYSWYEEVFFYQDAIGTGLAVLLGFFVGIAYTLIRVVNMLMFGSVWWQEPWSFNLLSGLLAEDKTTLVTIFINLTFLLLFVPALLAIIKYYCHCKFKGFRSLSLGTERRNKVVSTVCMSIVLLTMLLIIGYSCYETISHCKDEDFSIFLLCVLGFLLGIFAGIARISSLLTYGAIWADGAWPSFIKDVPMSMGGVTLPIALNTIFMVPLLLILLLHIVRTAGENDEFWPDFLDSAEWGFSFFPYAFAPAFFFFATAYAVLMTPEPSFDSFINAIGLSFSLFACRGFWDQSVYAAIGIDGILINAMFIASFVEGAGFLIASDKLLWQV